MTIQGVLPVIQTPYHDDYSIDFDTLRREIDWNFDCGVDGIVLAMVSEILRLSDDEREALTAATVDATAGRGPVIASVGAESTPQAVRHATRAQSVGAAAVMAIPPGLTRANAPQLTAYYRAILDAITIPVIIQDASGYIGNAIPIDVQAQLYRDYPGRVMFKPEAQPFGPNLSALRALVGPDAKIFEGTGGIALLDTYPRGIDGTMPGGEIPWFMVALWRALQANDWNTARTLHEPLAAMLTKMVNLDSWLATEKLFLHHQGIFPNTLIRPPVGYELDDATKAELLRYLHRLHQVSGREV